MRAVIDTVALLKIIEHCSTFRDSFVSGQLVGSEDDQGIEIANSFPKAAHSDHHGTSNPGDSHESSSGVASSATSNQEYETSTLKYLRSCQIDHGIVGWYMNSIAPLSFFTQAWIATQMAFQKSIEHSVFLCYDPIAASLGAPTLGSCIKAFRLSEAFVAGVKSKSFASIALDEILLPVALELKPSPLLFSNPVKVATLNVANFTFKPATAHLSKQFSGNAVLLASRLQERMNELLEKVTFEQERLKKRRKPEELSSSGAVIPELLFSQALLLEYSKYLLGITSA
jgi:hypothetical protein